MTARGRVHAHSWYSFDSILPPESYLTDARRRRLDFLCLTDHNTIAGARELLARNRDRGLEIVVGAEYATDRGDVIGLFLQEEIQSRNWVDVVGAIRDQGGVVVLPHPYRNHRLGDAEWAEVDLVEVFNARSSDRANREALREATLRGKAQTAGSDVHTAWELLRDSTLVELGGHGPLRERLLGAPRSFSTHSAGRMLTRYSGLVKAVRRLVGHPGVR